MGLSVDLGLSELWEFYFESYWNTAAC